MKKILTLLMILFLIFLPSCSGSSKNEEPSEGNKTEVNNSIDEKVAKEFLDNYMRFAMRLEIGPMKSYYSTKLKDTIKNIPVNKNPHPIGYKIEDSESGEGEIKFTTHIFSGFTSRPYYSDDTFKYTIISKNGKLEIDQITKDKSLEIYEVGKTLYKRDEGKIKGDKLLSLNYFPDFVATKGTAVPEQKFTIPKKAFGALAMSPDKKEIIFTSKNKNIFMAALSLKEEGETSEETLSNLQKKEGGDETKDSGGGSTSSDSGGESKVKLEFKQIDFFFDTNIDTIAFSPEGKSFYVEYTSSNGAHRLYMYTKKEESFEKKILSIERELKPGRFSIANVFFISEDEFVFSARSLKNTTKEEKNFSGDWKYSLKSDKLIKLN